MKSRLRGERGRIADRLHEILTKLEPRFEIGPAWNGLGYKLGKNYSCLVVGYKDHVKLMIWRGTELSDPNGLLRGSGNNTRHLRFDRVADVKPTLLRKLIEQQLQLYAEGLSYEAKPRKRARRKALPRFIRTELEGRGLLEAYQARPPYQRTDYVEWISSAKREPTQLRRLEQMLSELEAGDLYMKMPWKQNASRTG